MTEQTELKVVAVVALNNREALVLNRPLALTYEREGRDFVGSDGPFRDPLYYSHGSGRFVAFAGRELALQMKDGSVEKIKDHWWSGGIKGYVSVAYSDVESLKKCYVFYGGACIDPVDLAALRDTYTGCVYPYWDYEKVIKYDDVRNDLYSRLFHEEKRRKALVRAIRAKHRHMDKCIDTLRDLIDMEGPQPGTAAWAEKVRALITEVTGEPA